MPACLFILPGGISNRFGVIHACACMRMHSCGIYAAVAAAASKGADSGAAPQVGVLRDLVGTDEMRSCYLHLLQGVYAPALLFLDCAASTACRPARCIWCCALQTLQLRVACNSLLRSLLVQKERKRGAEAPAATTIATRTRTRTRTTAITTGTTTTARGPVACWN